MTLGYQRLGNGPERVIVMHDWMSTHQSYDDTRKYLDGTKFSYAFVDHRGYGLSRDRAGEYSAIEASADMVAVADALGWERFHVVAHSMSGMIAQRLSLDAPERLKSLVLVTPVTAAGMPLDDDGRALFEGAVTDDALWTTVAKAVTSDRLGARFYADKLKQHRGAVNVEAFAGFLKMWTTTDFSADMQNLATPVLVIAGAHDFPAFTKANYQASLGQWYRNATVVEFGNTGHYPMSETPPYFAKVVEDFLLLHA